MRGHRGCDDAILRGKFVETMDSALCTISTDFTIVAYNTTKATVDEWDYQNYCYVVNEDSF